MPLNCILVAVRLHELKGDFDTFLQNIDELINERVPCQFEEDRLLGERVNSSQLGWQILKLVSLQVELPEPLQVPYFTRDALDLVVTKEELMTTHKQANKQKTNEKFKI
jgi:hypothetical protein